MIEIPFTVTKAGFDPQRMSSGDIGYDLRAAHKERMSIGESCKIALGVSFDIPEGYYAELTHRSSLAFKKQCIISLGIIDSNFKGEVHAYVFNLSNGFRWIDEGERIAQIIFKKKNDTTVRLVESLESDGKKGFGSSGRI